MPPTPGDGPRGNAANLHQACMNAYDAAKAAGGTPPFTVDHIELHGNNPFTEYIVVLKPTG